jgi:hypothetical protein
MPLIEKIWLFRIDPISNLRIILQEGLYCKSSGKRTMNFISLGSQEIIKRRDSVPVECFKGTVINDYVPFYFSVRTPMLYNIITGHGVPAKSQEDIIYICFKLSDLATKAFQWCYTDGNAAVAISKFYTTLEDINSNIDWHSIQTEDFRDDNSDGDEDRIRKKHSEFLVKEHVPAEFIRRIVVLNENKAKEVEEILDDLNIQIEVLINPQKKRFYF